MPKPSAGAARWNQATSAVWSLVEANGAATLSRRVAVTLSTLPSWNKASVTAPIQAANSRVASTSGPTLYPLRRCHHIATEAARKAPLA